MKILSLGWGIQSFTLAAMSALGEIDPLDFAINADTTHERTATYEFAKRWTPWLEEREVKVVTVKNEKARAMIDKWGGIRIPAYTNSEKGGQAHRQCTGEWKIDPLRRYVQSVREGQPVEQWIGISLDEFQRMKPSDVKYITSRWPLIERKMTRHDCQLWLERHGLEIPPRSHCYFCPFQSKREWKEIKRSSDWEKAVAVDYAIRKARPPYDLYVCSQRKPLDECDFSSQEDHGQLGLDFHNDECTGLCFI